MQDCINNCLNYYAKTFILIQNSKMGKSRFINIFSKSYFIINYIFCKNNSYFFGNINILQFILLKFIVKVKKTIDKLQKKIVIINSYFIKNKKVTAIQNHNIIIGLFYFSFKIYKLYICKIVNLTMFRLSAKENAQHKQKSLTVGNLIAHY